MVTATQLAEQFRKTCLDHGVVLSLPLLKQLALLALKESSASKPNGSAVTESATLEKKSFHLKSTLASLVGVGFSSDIDEKKKKALVYDLSVLSAAEGYVLDSSTVKISLFPSSHEWGKLVVTASGVGTKKKWS